MTEIRRLKSYPYKVGWDVSGDMTDRFIYFVCRKDDMSRGKIGSTGNPLKRHISIQSTTLDTMEMVGLAIGSYTHERNLKLYLRANQIRGEWFNFNEEVQNFIARLPTLSEYIDTNSAPLMIQPPPEYMFELYKIGYTMEEIADFFGRTRQNVHEKIRNVTDDRWPKSREPVPIPISESYNIIVAKNPILSLVVQG